MLKVGRMRAERCKLFKFINSAHGSVGYGLLTKLNVMSLPGIYVLLGLVLIAGPSNAKNSCSQGYRCVSSSECNTNSSGVLYPCDNGKNLCCPIRTETVAVNRLPAAFPEQCGLLTDTNKIVGGQNASIGQFPWMALLGYKTQGIDLVQFLCGGSLISANYVLTAAHCLVVGKLELSIVRLGELDLMKDVDCEVLFNQTICADPYVDISIADIILHENFNSTTLKNDIGLIKLDSKVKFSVYIQPICLPFSININITEATRLTISGWGKTQAENLGGSMQLQYAHIFMWNKTRCEDFLTPAVRPLSDTQLCGNGPNAEDACKGDSGGPVFKETVIGLDLRNYQFGVISFAATPTCGNAELPTVYTKVDKYLKWIVDNAK